MGWCVVEGCRSIKILLSVLDGVWGGFLEEEVFKKSFDFSRKRVFYRGDGI